MKNLNKGLIRAEMLDAQELINAASILATKIITAICTDDIDDQGLVKGHAVLICRVKDALAKLRRMPVAVGSPDPTMRLLENEQKREWAADELREYADALSNGELDGAGRSLPGDLELLADDLETAQPENEPDSETDNHQFRQFSNEGRQA